jgi:predicted site-specific integrase-resolvase
MTRRVLLKPDAVAAQLGVSVGTLANWRVSGKGPRFVKLQSGGIRYDQADVEAEIAARVRCSTSDVIPEDGAAGAAHTH